MNENEQYEQNEKNAKNEDVPCQEQAFYAYLLAPLVADVGNTKQNTSLCAKMGTFFFRIIMLSTFIT